jgi:hypothetical protein
MSGTAPSPMIRMDEWQKLMEQYRREFRNQAEIIASILSKKHLPVYGGLQKADIRRRLPIWMKVMTIYIDETIEVMNTMWTIAQIEMRINSCFKWQKRKFKKRKKKDDGSTGKKSHTYEYKMVKTDLVDVAEYNKWKQLKRGPVAWLEHGKTMLASCRMIFDSFGDIGIVQAWREQTDKKMTSVFGIAPEALEQYGEVAEREFSKQTRQDSSRKRQMTESAESTGTRGRITNWRGDAADADGYSEEELSLMEELDIEEDDIL